MTTYCASCAENEQCVCLAGNKVSLNYQSQEVSVTLTYQIEREDSDVLAVVKEKSIELAQAHRVAWQTLRDAKVSAAGKSEPDKESKPEKNRHPKNPTSFQRFRSQRRKQSGLGSNYGFQRTNF